MIITHSHPNGRKTYDIIIDDIDDATHERIRRRAEANGRPIEDEARIIIEESWAANSFGE